MQIDATCTMVDQTSGYESAASLHVVMVSVRDILQLPPLQVNAGGLWEHWCEFSATLDASKAAEPVSISSEQAAAAAAAAAGSKLPKAANSSSTESSKGVAIPAVCGKRYRLAGMNADSTRALPTKGKVSLAATSTCTCGICWLGMVSSARCSRRADAELL
jgi:hypothetical protein